MSRAVRCSPACFALLLWTAFTARAADAPAQAEPARPPLSLASPASPASAGSPASSAAALLAERARQLFDEGVKLAAEGQLEPARAAFRGAYELQPHPSVLYNIAQCEVRLGALAAAVTTLTRFLDSSGAELQEEQRRAVHEQLAELRALLDRRAAEPASAASVMLDVRAPPPAVSPASIRPFVLAGAGVVLLATAAGLYVWNESRYERWRTERDELSSAPGFLTQLARERELWERARASNERLESVRSLEVVTLLVSGAGLIALGAGAWDFLASDEPQRAEPGSSQIRSSQARARALPALAVGFDRSLAPVLRWQGHW